MKYKIHFIVVLLLVVLFNNCGKSFESLNFYENKSVGYEDCKSEPCQSPSSSTTPSPNPISPTPVASPVEGQISDKDLYTIVGSGFGTKTGNHVFDDCTSSAPLSARWDRARPSAADSNEYNIQCRPAGYRNVQGPHSQTTGFIAGAFQGTGADSGQSVDLQKRFSYVPGGYTVFAAYRRFDPQWNFSGQDNNKIFGYSSSGIDMYGAPYWYIQYTSSEFPNASALPSMNIYDPESRILSPSGPIYSSRYESVNITTAWVKHEFVIRWGPNGFIRVSSNGQQMVSMNTVTTPSTTTGIVGIGGYGGQRGPNNFSYFADVYFDTDPNPGRFVLCQGTLCELQSYTQFTDTQVVIRVNKGRLVTGAVTLRYLNESSGNRDLGNLTIK